MNHSKKLSPPASKSSIPKVSDSMDRRAFVQAALAGALGAVLLPSCSTPSGNQAYPKPSEPAQDPRRGLGIPGPFPGRVIEVHHLGSVKGRSFVREGVHDMVARGMKELAGAPDATEAWRFFFQPGEGVGV